MTQQHTPGPWQIETWNYSGSRTVPTIRTAKDAIAQLCNLWRPEDNPHEMGVAEQEANARLIAAAPDMLAALKAFLRAPSIGSSGPGSVSIEVQTFNLNEARAAIAKAEGR